MVGTRWQQFEEKEKMETELQSAPWRSPILHALRARHLWDSGALDGYRAVC